MNFQVNLIMEAERRSASAFNLKAVLRVSSIVIPAAILLVVALTLLNFYQLKLEAERLRNEWAAIEPEKERAEHIRNQVGVNQKILKDLKGAACAHLIWHRQLKGLLRVTPPAIQLRSLSVSSFIHRDRNDRPARNYRLTLEGKVSGAASDQTVTTLKNRLLSDPPFKNAVDVATVASYGVDRGADAAPTDRAFRIDCTYKPLLFE